MGDVSKALAEDRETVAAPDELTIDKPTRVAWQQASGAAQAVATP